jgi:hypothetical protein
MIFPWYSAISSRGLIAVLKIVLRSIGSFIFGGELQACNLRKWRSSYLTFQNTLTQAPVFNRISGYFPFSHATKICVRTPYSLCSKTLKPENNYLRWHNYGEKAILLLLHKFVKVIWIPGWFFGAPWVFAAPRARQSCCYIYTGEEAKSLSVRYSIISFSRWCESTGLAGWWKSRASPWRSRRWVLTREWKFLL